MRKAVILWSYHLWLAESGCGLWRNVRRDEAALSVPFVNPVLYGHGTAEIAEKALISLKDLSGFSAHQRPSAPSAVQEPGDFGLAEAWWGCFIRSFRPSANVFVSRHLIDKPNRSQTIFRETRVWVQGAMRVRFVDKHIRLRFYFLEGEYAKTLYEV